jgi:AcrR family transcriptional regulator
MSAPDVREQLLQAALRVYAVSGLRGATTRRIAQEAGVNEVTLFRHFGSKDALIHEALAWESRRVLDSVELPGAPVDPERELIDFCTHQHRALWASRALIRTCMAEFAENPEPARMACESPNRIADALQHYLRRLRDAGLAGGDWHPRAAAAMLMGTVFADAMGRDCMPDRFLPAPDAIRQYVRLFLRAIGWVEPAPVRQPTGAGRTRDDRDERATGWRPE